MFIRKNKIRIIILQPVDGATDGATRRFICPASSSWRNALAGFCSNCSSICMLPSAEHGSSSLPRFHAHDFVFPNLRALYCFCSMNSISFLSQGDQISQPLRPRPWHVRFFLSVAECHHVASVDYSILTRSDASTATERVLKRNY